MFISASTVQRGSDQNEKVSTAEQEEVIVLAENYAKSSSERKKVKRKKKSSANNSKNINRSAIIILTNLLSGNSRRFKRHDNWQRGREASSRYNRYSMSEIFIVCLENA